jgi:hypothetical protein
MIRTAAGLLYLIFCGVPLAVFYGWWFKFDQQLKIQSLYFTLGVGLAIAVSFFVLRLLRITKDETFYAFSIAIYAFGLLAAELMIGHQLCIFFCGAVGGGIVLVAFIFAVFATYGFLWIVGEMKSKPPESRLP